LDRHVKAPRYSVEICLAQRVLTAFMTALDLDARKDGMF
jgi:hypothetical protein